MLFIIREQKKQARVIQFKHCLITYFMQGEQGEPGKRGEDGVDGQRVSECYEILFNQQILYYFVGFFMDRAD